MLKSAIAENRARWNHQKASGNNELHVARSVHFMTNEFRGAI